MILFAGIFLSVRNNKVEIKFVILFAKFKIHEKNQFNKSSIILCAKYPKKIPYFF